MQPPGRRIIARAAPSLRVQCSYLRVYAAAMYERARASPTRAHDQLAWPHTNHCALLRTLNCNWASFTNSQDNWRSRVNAPCVPANHGSWPSGLFLSGLAFVNRVLICREEQNVTDSLSLKRINSKRGIKTPQINTRCVPNARISSIVACLASSLKIPSIHARTFSHPSPPPPHLPRMTTSRFGRLRLRGGSTMRHPPQSPLSPRAALQQK